MDVVANYSRYLATLTYANKVELQGAWHKVLARGDPADPWRCAKCTLSSVQAVVWQAGWSPTHYDMWFNADGDRKDLGVGREFDDDVIRELRASLYAAKWKDASSHYCGDGLQHGVPQLDAVEEVARSFAKKGRPDLAKICKQVAWGASTTRDRNLHNTTCPVCGGCDSAEHRTYQCHMIWALLQDDEKKLWKQSEWLHAGLRYTLIC